MDFGTANKGYFPNQMQTKNLPPASPSNRKLPSLSKTTDLPSKIPIPTQQNSPKGNSFRDAKSPKHAKLNPLRLIPLSIEQRDKDNVREPPKLSPSKKKGLDGQKLFEGKHVAMVFDQRPISEQFAQELISNKLNKVVFKPYGDWLEKNVKKKTHSLAPALRAHGSVEVLPSPSQSKFKAKILTAKEKEDSIANDLKNKNIFSSREPSIKENFSMELSDSGSLKRSNPELSKFQKATLSSRTFDSSMLGKKSDKESNSSRDIKLAESILLHSNLSPRKSQLAPENNDNSKEIAVNGKGYSKTPEKSIENLHAQQQQQQPAETDIQPQAPKKLFQRKEVAGRAPIMFMGQKPGVSFANRMPVGLGQGVAAPSPRRESEEDKGKQQVSKKENFNGEIRGNILKWKLGEFIGAGNFGQVYQGMEVESARIIAVKKIAIGNAVNRELIDSLGVELNLLQKLKHKNIVQYLGHETIDNNLYIYLESMSGGNIANIIAKYGFLPEKTIKVYAKQILAGLIYLHENKVIHKDIKGANTLVDGDGTVKLADFGCSSQLEKTLSNFEGLLSNSLKGSIPWMAPEVVKETGYGRRSDVWSFGCTILEMATGKAPWSHYQFDNPVSLLMKIAVSEEIPLMPDTLSKELKDFLGQCLQRDPKNRPYAQDLLNHPFLQ